MHMVEKILNNTTPYGKIRASHEGSLNSSTLSIKLKWNNAKHVIQIVNKHNTGKFTNLWDIAVQIFILHTIWWYFQIGPKDPENKTMTYKVFSSPPSGNLLFSVIKGITR